MRLLSRLIGNELIQLLVGCHRFGLAGLSTQHRLVEDFARLTLIQHLAFRVKAGTVAREAAKLALFGFLPFMAVVELGLLDERRLVDWPGLGCFGGLHLGLDFLRR